VKVELGHPVPADSAEALTRRSMRTEPPILPELRPDTVRRWKGLPTWMPPESLVLCRHRKPGDELRTHRATRRPPPGYELEFDLGFVNRHAVPGAKRLVARDGGFELDDGHAALPDPEAALGFVEQAPLPMLDVLEVRALNSTGQHVLVAGSDDPLVPVTTPVATLGWVEGFPIQPKELDVQTGTRGLRTLVRVQDDGQWRHAYAVDPAPAPGSAVRLGGLLYRQAEGFTPLVALPDGRLRSDLLDLAEPPPSASLDGARWVAAPLGWARPPRVWAARAAVSRARRLARAAAAATPVSGGETLGWLRTEPGHGWSPLFSATHPALPDQFVTRSELEAMDLGYRVDGLLGYICDVVADGADDRHPGEILWTSRFGRRRRLTEGHAPR
jgi:hypothetical protein